jgi:hypothetical protein
VFSFTVELSGVRVPKLLKIPPALSAIVPTAVFPLTVAAMVGSASSYALWPMRPSACLALIRGREARRFDEETHPRFWEYRSRCWARA